MENDRVNMPDDDEPLTKMPNGFFDELTGADSEKLNRVDGMKQRRRVVVPRLPKTDGHSGSATLAHLATPFVDKSMNPTKEQLFDGAQRRFYTPQNDGSNGEQRDPKRRSITSEQAKLYERLRHDVVTIEQQHADKYVAFYTSQPPELRIAQDVYKKVYEREHEAKLPEDFHFLRYPGPNDVDFKGYQDVTEFVEAEMKRHGFVDDNVGAANAQLISANLALHGGLGHAGEETFHYFQLGSSGSKPPVALFMESYLNKFELDGTSAAKFMEDARAIDNTKEGSIVQILVPKEKMDAVAYLAHPHGLPHDDDLLTDLHAYGPIKYGNVKHDPEGNGGLSREKMNDEVTRNLADIRSKWDKITKSDTNGPGVSKDSKLESVPTPPSYELAKELHDRTLKRLQKEDFRPSKIIDKYLNDPDALRHSEVERQAERMERNPEHFGGQGMRSAREIERIQNRPSFIQARLLLSQNGGLLDPDAGIITVRHTTRTVQQTAELGKLVDNYVDGLFKQREFDRSMGQKDETIALEEDKNVPFSLSKRRSQILESSKAATHGEPTQYDGEEKKVQTGLNLGKKRKT